MKCKALVGEGEGRRFPIRYIDLVKYPDGHILRSNREMYEAFRAHFRYNFARCPGLPVQEFCGYLAVFFRLWEAGGAGYDGVVTECKFLDA